MIELSQVTRTYRSTAGEVAALDAVSLSIREGELVVVRGPSGCGKSTLLMIAGGMLRPTRGSVRVDGVELYAMSPGRRAAFRAARVGFVFQMFHLVPYLSVIENVMLAAHTVAASRDRAERLLAGLGMSARITHKPAALSAGERQRTAIARAMLNEPRLILADEPTGNLDPENAAVVFAALRAFRDAGGTVVVVTHGHEGDSYADRTIRMRAGRIVTEPAESKEPTHA